MFECIYKNPAEFLKNFYIIRRIEENDLQGKYELLKSIISYKVGTEPGLAALEIKLLKEKGFKV